MTARGVLRRGRARIRVLAGAPGKVADLGIRALGIVLAGSGVAHFIAPRLFVLISKPFFPVETRRSVVVNGAAETAIGLTLIDRRTRVLGLVGVIAYVLYLGDSSVQLCRNQIRGRPLTARAAAVALARLVWPSGGARN